MRSLHFLLIGFLIIFSLSCSSSYNSILAGREAPYIVRPDAQDSTSSMTHLGFNVYRGYGFNEGERNNGMYFNLSQSFKRDHSNFAIGAFGYYGRYKLVDEFSAQNNASPTQTRIFSGTYDYSGFGGTAMLNFREYKKDEYEFRFGTRAVVYAEYGDFIDIRRQLENSANIDFGVSVENSSTTSAALFFVTELLFYQQDNSKLSFEFNLGASVFDGNQSTGPLTSALNMVFQRERLSISLGLTSQLDIINAQSGLYIGSQYRIFN